MPNWKLYAYGAIVVGLIAAGWFANGWRLDAQKLSAAERQIERMQDVDRQNRELSTRIAELESEDNVIEREVIREVEVIREQDPDANCDASAYIQLRNAANSRLSRSAE